MENRYQHTVNGQSVLQGDLNGLAEVAALADDRLIAELFRLQPFDGATVRKGILTHRHAASGPAGLVATNGATGSVLVNPFRAVVGSRTAVATDAKMNWRDLRSAIAVGSTTLAQTVALAANASGNTRWDLVYAAVAVDANAASVTRKVKDPTTKLVTSQSVVTQLATTVSIGVVAGTPAASPSWPAVPSDSGGVYYVPLAYVRVPDGFGAASTVITREISLQAPVLQISPASGAMSVGPADGQHTLTSAQQAAFGLGNTRPSFFMPPDMVGGSSLLVALDLLHPSSANWSHQDGGVVDSRDWRDRLSRFTATVFFGQPEWATYVVGISNFPGPAASATWNSSSGVIFGMGSTFNSGGVNARACNIYGFSVSEMDDGATVALYADHADGGKLKVSIIGTPGVFVFIWLDQSAPFSNR